MDRISAFNEADQEDGNALSFDEKTADEREARRIVSVFIAELLPDQHSLSRMRPAKAFIWTSRLHEPPLKTTMIRTPIISLEKGAFMTERLFALAPCFQANPRDRLERLCDRGNSASLQDALGSAHPEVAGR